MKTSFDLIVKRSGKAICDFNMIEGGDRVAVGISGGKDSLTLFLVLQNLLKKAKNKFEIVPVYLSITENPPRDELLEFFKEAGTELKWFSSHIFQSVDKMTQERPGESPCRICSRFRRARLYECIKSINCNKLALGHHMDDIIETFMLNVFFAGKPEGMPPAVKAQNHDILLIRPMVYVREKLILDFKKNSLIPFPDDSCCVLLPDCTSMRQVVKEWVGELEAKNDKVISNAFAAIRKGNYFCPTLYGGKESENIL